MSGPSPLQRAGVEHAVQDVVTIGSILSKPRWSRIWHSANILTEHDDRSATERSKSPTAANITEETKISQETVNDDLGILVDLDALEKLEETNSDPAKYRIRGGHLFAYKRLSEVDEDYISPVTIGVVGKAYDDDRLEMFLERNGYNALHYCCMIVNPGLDKSELDGLAEALPELDSETADLVEKNIREVRTQLNEETRWETPN